MKQQVVHGGHRFPEGAQGTRHLGAPLGEPPGLEKQNRALVIGITEISTGFLLFSALHSSSLSIYFKPLVLCLPKAALRSSRVAVMPATGGILVQKWYICGPL